MSKFVIVEELDEQVVALPDEELKSTKVRASVAPA